MIELLVDSNSSPREFEATQRYLHELCGAASTWALTLGTDGALRLVGACGHRPEDGAKLPDEVLARALELPVELGVGDAALVELAEAIGAHAHAITHAVVHRLPVATRGFIVMLGARSLEHVGSLEALLEPLGKRVAAREHGLARVVPDLGEAIDWLHDAANLPAVSKILGSMEDGFVLFDRFGRVVLTNPIAAPLLGVNLEQGVTLPRLVHEGLMIGFLLDGESFDGVWTYIEDAEEDGPGRFLRTTGHPLYSEDDQLFGAFCMFRDITPQIEREEALHRSIREREAIATSMPGLILRVDDAMVITSASAHADNIWGRLNAGVEREELQQLQPTSLAKKLHAEIAALRLSQSKNRRVFELDAWLDDEQHTCKVHVVATGVRAEVLVNIQDISPKRRVEELLRLTRFAVDNASDAIFWVDELSNLSYVNRAASHELGVSQDELLSKTYPDICPSFDLDEWIELWSELEEAIGVRFDTLHKRASGEEYPVEVSVNRVSFAGKSYACLFARDITQRKLAEEEFHAYAERLKASNRDLEEFAYVASHDLQEPLRKITAFGDRLSARYGDVLDERGLDYLARMSRAAQRMSQLIEDLLKFSRVSTRTEPFEALDLQSLIQEVIGDLEVRIGETAAEVIIGESVPREIEADPLQMRQLFQNLISNAIKFARPGVAPRVEITCETLDPTELGAQQGYLSSQICEIVIEDNGIGFEPKYAEKIFAPFQRLHGRSSSYKGTGIGLAICRKIVERHRGTIAAIGLPDQGATFLIRLPLEQHSLQEEQRT